MDDWANIWLGTEHYHLMRLHEFVVNQMNYGKCSMQYQVTKESIIYYL